MEAGYQSDATGQKKFSCKKFQSPSKAIGISADCGKRHFTCSELRFDFEAVVHMGET
jgi:hypothetical protein